MEHFLHQTIETAGFSNSLTDELQAKIVQRLKNRTNLNWLSKNSIESEIRQFYRDKGIRLYWGIPKIINQHVSHKICAYIIKQCAKEHKISMTNIRPDDQNLFIVHNYMRSQTFINYHLANINKSKYRHLLWTESKLKQWQKEVSKKKVLIDNMLEIFESIFHPEITQGSIEKVAEKNQPIRSVLFRLNTN